LGLGAGGGAAAGPIFISQIRFCVLTRAPY
jgi:hypothetical protein